MSIIAAIQDMKARLGGVGASPTEMRVGREFWNALMAEHGVTNFIIEKGGGKVQLLGMRVIIYD